MYAVLHRAAMWQEGGWQGDGGAVEISSMRKFVVLAETLNFTEAARMLRISQPGLSKCIASLESELGVELVKRKPEVSLTAAGIFFLEKVERILAECDGLAKECKSVARSNRWNLTVVFPFQFDKAYLAYVEAFKGLRADNPYAQIQSSTDDRMPFFKRLATGKIDVGLMTLFEGGRDSYRDDIYGTFALRELCTDCCELWARTESDLASKPVVSKSDLEGTPLFVSKTAPFDLFGLALNSLAQTHTLDFDYVLCSAQTLEELVAQSDASSANFLLPTRGVTGPAERPLVPKRVMKTDFFEPLVSHVYFVYREGDENPLLQEFVSRVQRLVLRNDQGDCFAD